MIHNSNGAINEAGVGVKYSNPIFTNVSSIDKNIVFTSKNRCVFYPRCLLFNCCDTVLRGHISNYFNSIASPENRHIKHHFLNSNCDRDNSSIVDRLSMIPLSGVKVITQQVVEEGLAALPPTHPHAYKELESCCHFRVLYLVQGDNRANLPSIYSEMKDMIFLNYRFNDIGPSLYYPGSSFAFGRTALYLAARQLEISQGWLYDYFMFLDDDVQVSQGNFIVFEQFLQQWRPAVGGPSYRKYPERLFQAISQMDLLAWAFHR